MKIYELKKSARQAWEKLHTWKDGVVLNPEAWETVTRKFGDRRYKTTWIAIYSRFIAEWIYEVCDNAYNMLCLLTHSSPDITNAVLDQFLAFSDGAEILKDALEQVFASSQSGDDTPHVRILELLARRTGQRGALGFAA